MRTEDKRKFVVLILALSAILLVYVVAGVFLDFLFPTEYNTEFHYAIKYLSLPALVLAYMLLMIYQAANNVKVSFLEGLFYTGAIWLTLALPAGGYVAALNASFGEQTVCPIEGSVVRKFTTSGRYGGASHLEIFDAGIGRSVTIRSYKKEYESVLQGDRYRTELLRGSLGLYYEKVRSTQEKQGIE